MSVIDGGSFKCYNHDPIYETVDPTAWAEHLRNEEGLTEAGSSACVVCGNPVEYTDKPINKKAVCDTCKEDLK